MRDSERTLELRLRAAVESSPSGLMMVDAASCIVLVNREVERLFGYTRDELLGQAVDILIPEHGQSAIAMFTLGAEPSQAGTVRGGDLHLRRKDGSEVPVEIGSTTVATPEGLFVISSIVDLTARAQADVERAQLEELLRQAQKMEALGRLAGGIAHDFNNILGAIVGYAELVRPEVASSPQASSDMDDLLRAASRGKELVERIMRFSRRQDVVPRAVDLGQVVREVTRLLRATLPAGIEIRLSIDPASPKVLADATSVHQVLMNLATNAAQAMPDGGQLEIDVKPHVVRDIVARTNAGLREGPHVLLEVRDTGHGMDAATRARAFEPFFSTKAAMGSGLGLAQVHGILRDHGGMVWLDSEVGAGTTIRCLFPAVEQLDADVITTPPVVSRGHGQRILYVDDEASLVTVGKRRLESLGYEVVTATDPMVALDRFRKTPSDFDLVVTDYSMPRMNGLELARQLVALRPGIPVVLATGYMEEFPADLVGGAGVRRILPKPLTLATLSEAVSQVLRPH